MKYEEIKDGVLVVPKGTKFIDSEWKYKEMIVLRDYYRPTYYKGRQTLVRLEVTDGVKKIGGWAFDKCAMLEWVYISDSVTDVCMSAFEDCKRLEYIRLPQKIKRIKEGTFWGCSRLKQIEIPERVEFIGNWAFAGTAIESIFIPLNVKKIYKTPFSGCRSLKEIIVDERNESYVSVDGVLYTKDMKTLVCYPMAKEDEIYTVPKGVENLQHGCFWGNEHLKILRFPDTLKKIRDYEFSARKTRLLVRVGWRTRLPENECKNVRFIVL